MLPKRDFNFVKNDPETPKTQLVMVTGFLVVAALLDSEIPAYFALFIGLTFLIIPAAGNALVFGWYKIAEVMSRIVNPIILGLMYFLFITPIALLFRLFGNDPLALKDQRGSIYDYHDKTYKKEDLEKPW